MDRDELDATSDETSRPARRKVRLPRFLVSEPVGLGDVVKKATTSVGVRPCASCEQRAHRMNQWLRIAPRD